MFTTKNTKSTKVIKIIYILLICLVFVAFVVNHHLVHRLAVICRPVKTLVLPCVSDMILWQWTMFFQS